MSKCGGGDAGAACGGRRNDAAVHDSVQEYYGKVLATKKDLKTSACSAGGKVHPKILELMAGVPEEVMSKFYGVTKDSLHAQAAALVGPSGSVIGVDMTDEQLEVARRHSEAYCRHLGYGGCNMAFKRGCIERLAEAGIEPECADLVLSNCVVNLSPDKPAVLAGAWRALVPGGEFFFSDVYCDRRLPNSVRRDEAMWGECIAGALYEGDFREMARAAGFLDVREYARGPIAVRDTRMCGLLGGARFFSITFRLFKLPGLQESGAEDYGQAAMYKGTIDGHEHSYKLDATTILETGRAVPVSGNTAAALGEGGVSHLAGHFEIIGNRTRHFGRFGCVTPASSNTDAADADQLASCCS